MSTSGTAILLLILLVVLLSRKIEISEFASRTRQMFVRLLALVKWANSVSKVEKCAVCKTFIYEEVEKCSVCKTFTNEENGKVCIINVKLSFVRKMKKCAVCKTFVYKESGKVCSL